MYEVKRSYPSNMNPGWVTVRFTDYDANGNPHILDISNGKNLEFRLVASSFLIAEYQGGVFRLLYEDIHEKEMVERLCVALTYLSTNQACSALWLIVRNHQKQVEALVAQYM